MRGPQERLPAKLKEATVDLSQISKFEVASVLQYAARRQVPVRVFTKFGERFDGIPALPIIDDGEFREPTKDELGFLSKEQLWEKSNGNLQLHAYSRVKPYDAPLEFNRSGEAAHLCLHAQEVRAVVRLTGDPVNLWY